MGGVRGKNMEEEREGCCCKTTVRDAEERKKLVNRLNRMEGQIRGIKAMVEKNAYCADILTQSAAVNAALDSFNRDLICSHLKTCVARDLKAGKNEVVDELADILRRLMR